MYYIVNAKQSRQADSETIKLGTKSISLMESAGVEAYNRIRNDVSKRNRILVVCGTGGNGGDGYVLARCLHDSGYKYVDVLPIGKPENPDCLANANAYKGNVVDKIAKRYDAFVDCIFGTGLTKNVSGKAFDIIRQINALPGKKVSIDVPSGIDASSGEVKGLAFRCDLLLTIQFLKTGFFLNESYMYFKKMKILDISIDLSNKNMLPIFFTLPEVQKRSPSLRQYRLIDCESLSRFQGIGDAFFGNFAFYFRYMALLRKEILVLKESATWITDGKKIVVIPSHKDKDIRKAISLLG